MASKRVRLPLDNATVTSVIDIDDRLSNLPIEVLYNIFSYIDAIDVVRTCVLSKTWQRFWIEVPYLKFDSELRYLNKLSWSDDVKFWKFFYRMLMVRDGSSLTSLSVNCTYLAEYQLQGLLCLASSKKLQQLKIDCIDDCHPHNSLELFQPLCQSLEILKLYVPIYVQVGNLRCLSHLKVLHLEGFEFVDDIFVQTLFPNSKLEELYIHGCRMDKVKRLNIAGSNLKKFKFINFIGDESFKGKLIVSAPNLIYLRYIGITIAIYSMSSLTLLHKAYINFKEFTAEDDYIVAMPALVNAFENAYMLTLSAIFVRSLYLPSGGIASKLIPLHKLKRLEIELRCSSRHMEGLIEFLKLAPGIEALSIILKKRFGKKKIWTTPDEDLICLSHHLKVIKIFNFNDGSISLELVKFLLRKGDVLCSMDLMYEWEMAEYTCKKISALYKASKVVSISFARKPMPFYFGLIRPGNSDVDSDSE